MSRDPRCLKLAELHSTAVDFQKSGKPAELKDMPMAPDIKPDWSLGELVHDAEIVYESQRALGVLFRNIELPDVKAPPVSRRRHLANLTVALANLSLYDSSLMQDRISSLLRDELEPHISLVVEFNLAHDILVPQFKAFASHLTWICAHYSLTRRPLTEEECWVGTIVAKSWKPRRRNDLQAGMREQCKLACDHILQDLTVEEDIESSLERAWAAWTVSLAREGEFGAKVYGWIALGALFDGLKAIREREEEQLQASEHTRNQA